MCIRDRCCRDAEASVMWVLWWLSSNWFKAGVCFGLAQVCCDNLALNGLFGCIECFSADYFCTICFATEADIQIKTCEHEFQLCTIAEYDCDVACDESKPCGSHSRCVLFKQHTRLSRDTKFCARSDAHSSGRHCATQTWFCHTTTGALMTATITALFCRMLSC